MFDSSSENIPQDGGAGVIDPDEIKSMVLSISSATICLTCLILICIINNKTNC